MYKVHLEWQTRVCPVGVASLTRQFRRYFNRFEGRIREPPYAVYDDLAYTQGNPPTVLRSPTVDYEIGTAEEFMAGPNLEEYRERLRGFANDLGKEDEVMQNVYPSNEHLHDIGDLYNFGALGRNPSSIPPESPFPDQHQINEPVFSNLEAYQIADAPGFTNNHDPQGFTNNPDTRGFARSGTAQDLPPFELGSIPSSQHSMSLLFDETDIDLLENDLFGDMPDMPALDGTFDQNFLEFLDTHQ